MCRWREGRVLCTWPVRWRDGTHLDRVPRRVEKRNVDGGLKNAMDARLCCWILVWMGGGSRSRINLRRSRRQRERSGRDSALDLRLKGRLMLC